VCFQTQVKIILLIIINVLIEFLVKVYESIKVQVTYLTTLAVSGLYSVEYTSQCGLMNDYALLKKSSYSYLHSHGIFLEKDVSVFRTRLRI
jgi:hypothetical protein